jgi:large exoprotein involved in heme utilization and adhesion
VTVNGQLSIIGEPGGGFTGIASSAEPGSTGNAGEVTVSAGSLSIATNGAIRANTSGSGNGGSVSVAVDGEITIDGRMAAANMLTGIAANAEAGGNAGNVTVNAATLMVTNNGQIASATFGSGNGGTVSVNVIGQTTIDATSANPNFLTGIVSQADPSSTGNAGAIRFRAGSLAIINNGEISARTFGLGASGDIAVDVTGSLVINGSVNPSGLTGIFATTIDPNGGNAGRVNVAAGDISILNSGLISTSTFGRGAAGQVSVSASGEVIIDGSGTPGVASGGIASNANSGNGNAGGVAVTAGGLSISSGGEIQTVTLAAGTAGDVTISVLGDILINGLGSQVPTGIFTGALLGSTSRAGAITLSGQRITIGGTGVVSSSTDGAGDGGTVRVIAGGPLSLRDTGSGIIASATSTASGNAGSATVSAPQITITTGAEIASTTAGTGAGGSVDVTTGTLVLNGGGDPNTQIAASAIGPQSGSGGSVTVSANSLTVEGGAQIASSTAGPGQGGDVNVTVASDIVLPDSGPQITARSTGSGDAGSIIVAARRLLMSNGATISTDAETSTASGGNITLHVRDFLYLVSSEITTSVKGKTGNGGNIVIDPQLVILNHSSIIAQAVEGHGGNIMITAGEFIPSSDSVISATSQLGISGTIAINGPRVDVNGALVVLSSQLSSRAEVLREACAARSDRPVSTLATAGRGGLPQDPEATLPALYIASRDLNSDPRAGADNIQTDGAALQTTVHLSMRCG